MNIETIQALQESLKKRIDKVNEQYYTQTPEALSAMSHGIEALIALDKHVEWVMGKDLDDKLCEEDPRDEVVHCAKLLRKAQKEHMAYTGTQEDRTTRVGVSAKALDDALAELDSTKLPQLTPDGHTTECTFYMAGGVSTDINKPAQNYKYYMCSPKCKMMLK